jgi:hypothetical protein
MQTQRHVGPRLSTPILIDGKLDDPRAVRVSLRERDNIFSDDYFGIMIDTYGDHAWGYEFFVNPLGIQGDLRIGPDGTSLL